MEKFFAEIIGRNKFFSFLEIGRPWNGILLGTMAVLGTFLYSQIPLSTVPLFLTFFFIYMGGTTLNDIYDYKTDSTNMPYRPIERGSILPKEAFLAAAVFYFIGLTIGFSLGKFVFIGGMLTFILSIIYSVPPIKLVNRGVLGGITLSLVTIFTPFITGVIFSLDRFYIPHEAILLAITITSYFFFILINKDFKDIKGDKLSGKKTFVIIFGEKNSTIVSRIGSTLFLILSVIFLSPHLEKQFILSFYILSATFLAIILKSTTIPNGRKKFLYLRLTNFAYFIIITLLLFLGI